MLSRTAFRPAFTPNITLRAVAPTPQHTPVHKRVVNTSVLPAQLLTFILEQDTALHGLPLGARAQLVAETIEDLKTYLPLSSSPSSSSSAKNTKAKTKAVKAQEEAKKKDNEILATCLLPFLASALASPDVPLEELADRFQFRARQSSTASVVHDLNTKKRHLVHLTHESLLASSIASTTPTPGGTTTSSSSSSVPNTVNFNQILNTVYNREMGKKKPTGANSFTNLYPMTESRNMSPGNNNKKNKKNKKSRSASPSSSRTPAPAAEVLPPIPATIFDSYTSSFHHHLLANWDLCLDIVPGELRLATIFELIRKHGLLDTYSTKQILEGLAVAKSRSNAHRDEFVYSSDRERYYHRRLITDRSLHPLLLSGTQEDLRCLSWILFFESVKFRFPGRPRRVPVPHYARGYSKLLHKYDYLPFMARFAAILLDPSFTGNVLGQAEAEYTQALSKNASSEKNSVALKDLLSRRKHQKLSDINKNKPKFISTTTSTTQQQSSEPKSTTKHQDETTTTTTTAKSDLLTDEFWNSSPSSLSNQAWSDFHQTFANDSGADPIVELLKLRGEDALRQHLARQQIQEEHDQEFDRMHRKLARRYEFDTVLTTTGDTSSKKTGGAIHAIRVKRDKKGKTTSATEQSTSVSLIRRSTKQRREQERIDKMIEKKKKKALLLKEKEAKQAQRLDKEKKSEVSETSSKKTTKSNRTGLRGRPKHVTVTKKMALKQEAARRRRENARMLLNKRQALAALKKARKSNFEQLQIAQTAVSDLRKRLRKCNREPARVHLRRLIKKAIANSKLALKKFKAEKKEIQKKRKEIMRTFKTRQRKTKDENNSSTQSGKGSVVAAAKNASKKNQKQKSS